MVIGTAWVFWVYSWSVFNGLLRLQQLLPSHSKLRVQGGKGDWTYWDYIAWT